MTVSGDVAAKIREARKGLGWSMADLAAHCQRVGADFLTENVIENIESGRPRDGERTRLITLEELLAISQALGVAPAVLFPDAAAAPDSLPEQVLNATQDMPVEAAVAYMRGALRLLERWQTDFQADKTKADIFRDPARSPFALGRRDNPDGTVDLT